VHRGTIREFSIFALLVGVHSIKIIFMSKIAALLLSILSQKSIKAFYAIPKIIPFFFR
jgi:hypothetical protein